MVFATALWIWSNWSKKRYLWIYWQYFYRADTDHSEGVRGQNVLSRAQDDGVKSDVWREVGPQPFMVTQVIRVLEAKCQQLSTIYIHIYLRNPQLIWVVFCLVIPESYCWQGRDDQTETDRLERMCCQQSAIPSMFYYFMELNSQPIRRKYELLRAVLRLITCYQ